MREEQEEEEEEEARWNVVFEVAVAQDIPCDEKVSDDEKGFAGCESACPAETAGVEAGLDYVKVVEDEKRFAERQNA